MIDATQYMVSVRSDGVPHQILDVYFSLQVLPLFAKNIKLLEGATLINQKIYDH